MNIHNFANRQLCEYQTIFPTVASLLDHILFVNGNGYYFNDKTGMIIDGNRRSIDQYPEMNDAEWDALIQSCHEKERRFAQEYADRGISTDPADLEADCAAYKRVAVDDSRFTAEALYADLCAMRAAREEYSYVRPYPFSRGYADIYSLNENTPKWFVQIAVNFCNAWIRFLNEELENNNVWIKPSLRPVTEESKARAEAMAELFEMIKEDADYDGWLDKPITEPQSDYADLDWTTKYRDSLVMIVATLETLL